jgi:hypothetical protein
MRIIKSQQKQGRTFVCSLNPALPHCGQCPCYADASAEPSPFTNLNREVQFHMKDFDCLLWPIWQMMMMIIIIYLFSIPEIHQSGYRTCQ